MTLSCDADLRLWRYNVTPPPEQWEAGYISPEYQWEFRSEGLVAKNQANLLFFYDDRDQCVQTGSEALRKLNEKDGGNRDRLWITHANPVRQFNVLDLSHHIDDSGVLAEHETPLHIIFRLHDLGIDVLTDDFNRFDLTPDTTDRVKIPFSEVRGDFCRLKELLEKPYPDRNKRDCAEIGNIAGRINGWFRNCISYTGQLLTDFENGHVFKEMLTRKGYSGYAFREEANSKTFCVFDSSLLSSPIHEEIIIDIPETL